MNTGTLLAAAPAPDISDPESLSRAQLSNPDLHLVIEYLQEKKLPEDPEEVRHVELWSALFVILDHILFYHDSKRGIHRVSVQEQLRRRMLEEHCNLVGGHFSADKIVPPLHPIPGTPSSPNTCAETISNCQYQYHGAPQDNTILLHTILCATAWLRGSIECWRIYWRNMLLDLDKNWIATWTECCGHTIMHHMKVLEKSHRFCWSCTPTEAALLLLTLIQPCVAEEYREELTTNLSSARKLACKSLCRFQKKSKEWHGKRKAVPRPLHVGDWELERLPVEESGKNQKLAHPWYCPYRIISLQDPDVTVVQVYKSPDKWRHVHLSHVTLVFYPGRKIRAT